MIKEELYENEKNSLFNKLKEMMYSNDSNMAKKALRAI
jgi:hypothetical protein